MSNLEAKFGGSFLRKIRFGVDIAWNAASYPNWKAFSCMLVEHYTFAMFLLNKIEVALSLK